MSERLDSKNEFPLFKFDSAKDYAPWLLTFLLVLISIFLLRSQGRLWWCKFGDYAIYINEAWNSSHTSQHLFDPYTLTHILHGILFFWLTALIFSKLSPAWRLFIAVLVEAAWEVLENTNFIIEKYRENTASLDYFGDSVFNSVGDIFACAAGFVVAFKLGWRRSLALFVLTEIVLLVWIHDSFLLNVIMLIYPFESLKQWQMGA